jgi:hypothetical protein
MKTQIKKMKQQIKEIASQIKSQKPLRKKKHPHHDKFIGEWSLFLLSRKVRHLHVAYCLIRGRTLEQVDSGVGLDMEYVNWLIKAADKDSKEKLYVVVNDKLSMSQQAVQSAHAVAEFLKQNPNTLWDNGYLVLLKDAPNRDGNMVCYGTPRNYQHEYAEFKEPDLGNTITAYASFGPDASLRFKNLGLL